MEKKVQASSRYIIWIVVLFAAILSGLFTAYKLITGGLGILGGTDIVIWPLPIATYVFFALTSTGLTFVASMPLVFGMKKYELIAKRAVFLGIASLLAAFVTLSMDLGSISKLFSFITSPNFASPMWWMGAFYLVELVMLLVKFWRMHKGDWYSQTSKVIGIIALISAIAASITLGWLFGSIESRPAYLGGFAPVFFLVTALLSGLSLIILFSLAYQNLAKDGLPEEEVPQYDGLGKILAFVTGFSLVLFLVRMIVGLSASNSEFLAFNKIASSLSFQFVLWLGSILPLVLMLLPKVRSTTWGKTVAAALVLIGLFIDRMDYVLVGQLKPLGVRAMELSGLAQHRNTVWEWLVVASSLAFLLLVFTLGERYLKLEASS